MSGNKEDEEWKIAEIDLKRDGKRSVGRRKAPFYKVYTLLVSQARPDGSAGHDGNANSGGCLPIRLNTRDQSILFDVSRIYDADNMILTYTIVMHTPITIPTCRAAGNMDQSIAQVGLMSSSLTSSDG